MVRLLFEGELNVQYGFIYVCSGDTVPDGPGAVGGQVNGLCGAAQPGVLTLTTGLHTGPVPLRFEVHDAERPVSSEWEDVVEVSFTSDVEELSLSTFDQHEPDLRLPGPGSYRARYCAVGMDAGRAADLRERGGPVVDRYLLQLWPSPPAPDAVVREGSAAAAYWHSVARGTPAPPPPPDPQEVAAAAAAEAEAEAERQRLYLEQLEESRTWGAALPSDRVRSIGGRTPELFRDDPGLVELLADLTAQEQRAIAVWAAHHACDTGQLTEIAVVREALEALTRRQPLPAALGSHADAWRRVFPAAPGEVVTVTVRGAVGPGQRTPAPEAAAIDAIFAAADDSPDRAVMGAVCSASHGQHDLPVFLASVREACAGLRRHPA